uniref:Uncharacterized protein n=1 Tax=Rhizophagus irregularis (strain DAOM 181602 / DAOM 197198 / MUCL 43194) TaxID=747089 RepID=U9UH53_RHIID
MEWYCAATIIAPIEVSISADIGPVFEESAGFWIFMSIINYAELINEGDHLLELAKANISLKDQVIIDFHHHTKQVRGLNKIFGTCSIRITIKCYHQNAVVGKILP